MIQVKAYSDIFVRYLLGDEDNKDLLISFINAVNEDYDLPTISSVEIKNPYNLKAMVLAKESILDVKATDKDGRIYNIEIQTSGSQTYYNRSLYYWAKLYSSQLDEGEYYGKLKPTISINLLNFELFPRDEIESPHSCFVLKEKKCNKVLSNHLILHFIEMGKFIKENNFASKFDKWLAYFKYEGNKEEIMDTLLKDDGLLNKAHKRYKVFTKNDEMLEMYEARMKWLSDKATEKHEAFEDGLKEGLRKKTLEDAKRLLELGVNIETISKATGLSQQEIDKL